MQIIKEEIMQIINTINCEGFFYDWTMTWNPSGEETNGAGDWELLQNPAAREAAKMYEDEVLAASREAANYEREAVAALEMGDINTAIKAFENAARMEKKFGDDPTYRSVIKRLTDILLDNEEERDDR